MTANPQDRERLADLLGYNLSARDYALKKADELLAAGVTLPPAPKPPLLTEQQVGELWDRSIRPTGWGPFKFYMQSHKDAITTFATAAAEEAIRGRVREKTEGTHDNPHVLIRNSPNIAIGVAPSGILAFFGLE